MQVEKTKENLKKCICMDCPSYTMGCKIRSIPENLFKLAEDLEKVDHYEKMFCAFSKSECIKEDKGCICPECEIHKMYDLNREDCFRRHSRIRKKSELGRESRDVRTAS